MGLDITVYDEDNNNVYEFRAGSYSGYNEWRLSLARLIGKTDQEIWDDPQPGPFVELINFSDCEGTIHARTAAKLYADFRNHLEAAKKHDWGGWAAYGVSQYAKWMEAFKRASTGGRVVFH